MGLFKFFRVPQNPNLALLRHTSARIARQHRPRVSYGKFLGILVVTMGLSFNACDVTGGPGEGPSGDAAVEFQGVIQTGGISGTADTTALTLSFSADPTTLSADNITVTGATKGTLSGSGPTRSLAISNITVADGASVSIAVSSPAGYVISGSAQTTAVYRVLSIGMDYLGGKIAYILQSGDPGYNAALAHGLIAAPADQSTGIVWISGGSTQTTLVPGGTDTAIGAGSANTDNIIAQAVAAGNTMLTTYAAGVARNYTGGGYTDWYLPAREELRMLYQNRSLIGGFSTLNYWSSSEDDYDDAWYTSFGSGYWFANGKDHLPSVRAVRAF